MDQGCSDDVVSRGACGGMGGGSDLRSDETLGISRRELMVGIAVAGVAVGLSGAVSEAQQGGTAGAGVASGAEAAAVPIKLKVNGKEVEWMLEPRVSLLDALREHAGMTGTKKGCDHGQCGACTVLADGGKRRVNACLRLAVMHQGDEIVTVEGLANGEMLHPVQAAFLACDGFQCGYCTPGQICSAVGLIAEGHAKTEEEIREGMSGNLCRCGAYPNIVKAVQMAMRA